MSLNQIFNPSSGKRHVVLSVSPCTPQSSQFYSHLGDFGWRQIQFRISVFIHAFVTSYHPANSTEHQFLIYLFPFFSLHRKPACDSGGDAVPAATLDNQLFPRQPSRRGSLRWSVLRDAELDDLLDRKVRARGIRRDKFAADQKWPSARTSHGAGAEVFLSLA